MFVMNKSFCLIFAYCYLTNNFFCRATMSRVETKYDEIENFFSELGKNVMDCLSDMCNEIASETTSVKIENKMDEIEKLLKNNINVDDITGKFKNNVLATNQKIIDRFNDNYVKFNNKIMENFKNVLFQMESVPVDDDSISQQIYKGYYSKSNYTSNIKNMNKALNSRFETILKDFKFKMNTVKQNLSM
ncbi:uncharacterized protein LOC126901347 [Daktulosphaira vitifoliae]|uniref:uncharacterized protein LOC126901347 n=1 Tax=Daktulosphaira vitifoliae TaxID=58002 RepID=UPI0021AAAA00|nr:uncharacterized protein LOC126901347 [Daktulosphaira vitifoliae]